MHRSTCGPLSVLDRRPYILDGDKDPDFVGLQRGGFGNPFKVTTESGRPLAEDMTESLRRGLSAGGFAVTVLTLAGDAPDAVRAAAASAGVYRVVLLNVNNWKTDVYMDISLHYDLLLRVFDRSGAVISESKLSGIEEIAGAGFEGKNSASAAQAFERKIGYLFNVPDIKAALAP